MPVRLSVFRPLEPAGPTRQARYFLKSTLAVFHPVLNPPLKNYSGPKSCLLAPVFATLLIRLPMFLGIPTVYDLFGLSVF